MCTMEFIEQQLIKFKKMIEDAIREGGTDKKASVIRSSKLINLIHDAVKYELIQNGVEPEQIFPHFEKTKPEIKLAGYLKLKDQDICVQPINIEKSKRTIDWGPLAFQHLEDRYGHEYSENTLVINVRSQMSSLAKNLDTLFERTFAEALNLHMQYHNMVMGEVYMIPAREYDAKAVKEKKVKFIERQVDVEKYISLFNAINNRKIGEPNYKYERCALLIVDFSPKTPKLFRTSEELKKAGLVSKEFQTEYSTLSFDTFAKDILNIYKDRYNIENILKKKK